MVEPPVPNKQDHQDSDKISPWAVVRVDRSDEVARYDPGALMERMVNGDQQIKYKKIGDTKPARTPNLVDQLVECMLTVGTGLTPHNRTGGMVDLDGF